MPFVLVWVLATAGPRSLVPKRWALHLLRGALGMAMIGCFVYALRSLPLSTAYTIYFVAPLLIAALSVPLLGEHVGPRRWIAIGIGLIGVLVVLRPGVGGFISVPGLMVLLAATAYAVAAITVSMLTRTDTPQSMVVWFLVIMAVGAGLLALPDWQPLQLGHAALIAGMGLAGAGGQVALTRAFQLGEASLIAPLEYTGLVWVIGWDLLFWGALPDRFTWLGAAIIVRLRPVPAAPGAGPPGSGARAAGPSLSRAGPSRARSRRLRTKRNIIPHSHAGQGRPALVGCTPPPVDARLTAK